MGYLSEMDLLRTTSLIKGYQSSGSIDTKKAILSELYGLWGETIFKLVWYSSNWLAT